MSRISSTDTTPQATVSTQGEANDLREVDMDQFLQLLIVELQNQDPLNPMENSEILEQIGQIREISATNHLSDTLAAVLEGQNMTTASSLIGKRVNALSDSGINLEGVVDRVSIDTAENGDGARMLHVQIGDQKIRLENIREIVRDEGGEDEK